MNIYTYKGQQVFLANMADVPGVEPIDSFNSVGCFPVSAYNGCDTLLTYDSEDYFGEEEIVCTECMNVENEQALAEAWYTKDYAEVDEVARQLCVRTTRYHRWTSELSRLIRRIEDKADDGVVSKDFVDECRKDWTDTVKSYTDKISPDNPLDAPDIPSIEDVLEFAGVVVE